MDVTKDVTAATYEYSLRRPATINRETETIRREDLETAAQMIEEAKKPYIFVGGGCVISGASKEISELAHKIRSAIALWARALFPEKILCIQECLACMEPRLPTLA